MAEQAKQTEKTAKKLEAKLRVQIGKQPTTVEEWIHARAKMPHLFTFTEDGNLVSPPFTAGETEKTIYLAPEEHTTIDELKAYFTTRATELKEPEEVYAAAKRRLREVIEAYKSGQQTTHDVIEANNDVHEAECILNAKAKGARYVQEYGGLMERELTFNIHDTRNFPTIIFVTEYSVFPWRAFWKKGSVGEAAAATPVAGTMPAQAPPSDTTAARTGAIIARRRAAKSGQVPSSA